MNASWNFLEAEKSICERLEFACMQEQNGIPAWCTKVATRQEMTQIIEGKQVTPALYVIYAGEVVQDSSRTQTLEAHRFYVVLTVKNAADQRTAGMLHTAAGIYLPRVKSALKDFTPQGTTGPLKQVTPPAPYYSSGFAYFPLMFEAQVLFSTTFGPGVAPATPTNQSFTPTVKK